MAALRPAHGTFATAARRHSDARRMSGTVRMRDVRGGAATTSAGVATI
jgi:hypothetical protein